MVLETQLQLAEDEIDSYLNLREMVSNFPNSERLFNQLSEESFSILRHNGRRSWIAPWIKSYNHYIKEKYSILEINTFYGFVTQNISTSLVDLSDRTFSMFYLYREVNPLMRTLSKYELTIVNGELNKELSIEDLKTNLMIRN